MTDRADENRRGIPASEAGDRRDEMRRYVMGFGGSLLLTALAFLIVGLGWIEGQAATWTLAGLALAQIVVQLAFFLHIDLKRSHRDDLQLVLYTLLVILLMLGGSIVILFSQHARMDPAPQAEMGQGSY